MKLFNKQILEAIQRGINLAIDDFNDDIDIEAQKVGQIKHSSCTRELIIDKYFIDLGLPSGTCWAKYNVGVDPNKLNRADDWYGGYYAWGDINPKSVCNWEKYKYTNGSYNKLTKYCSKDKTDLWNGQGKPDGILELLPEDDIAYQQFKNKFDNKVKMPSKKQINELLRYTFKKWVHNYKGIDGLNGRIFTSKINGNQLFIPAGGYKIGSSNIYVGQECYIWSSSVNSDSPINAWFLNCYSFNCYTEFKFRYNKMNIRPTIKL